MRDALRSAELMKRRQQPTEGVDRYAQDFERLFHEELRDA